MLQKTCRPHINIILPREVMKVKELEWNYFKAGHSFGSLGLIHEVISIILLAQINVGVLSRN